MILLFCPKCKRAMRSVQTKMTILATGWLQIVAGEEGIGQAIAPPVRREPTTPMHILPVETFICARCSEEIEVGKWKYVVACDQCEDRITLPVKNPNKTVEKQICRDTRSIYCDDCWVRIARDYCGECRYNSTCLRYNQ